MKTVKFIPILTLALVLIGATSTYARKPQNLRPAGTAVSVRHEVNVHFTAEKPICNLYQVELLDANGRSVASPQAFIQGKETYTFYEQTRVSVGIRIARLVLTPNIDRYVCQQELFTPPAVKVINFIDHETYTFDLVPMSNPSKITD